MRTTAQAVKVNFRFTEGLRKRLDSLSVKMDVPISEVVRKAVESYDPAAVSIIPSEADQTRLAACCEAIGCSSNFILRCALMEYLDRIDRHGFRTSVLVAPGEKRDLVFQPKAPEVPDWLKNMTPAEAHKFYEEAKAEIAGPRTPEEEAESARWSFEEDSAEQIAAQDEAMNRARVEFDLDEQLEGLKISQAERDALLAIRLGAIGTIAAGAPAVSQPVLQTKPRPPTLPSKPVSQLPSPKHNPKKK